MKDLYERSIGNIIGAAINATMAAVIAVLVYVFVLPNMSKKQYENTLLMGAITQASNLKQAERNENSRYEVFPHLKKMSNKTKNRIQNRIFLLLAMYNYKYMESTLDFGDDNVPAVVYFDREDKSVAEQLAILVNLILPPGKGEPITARLESQKDPKDGHAGQLGLWLADSD